MKNRVMLLLVMASVAAGFFLVLKIGFLLHCDPIPPLFTSTSLTFLSASILIATVTIGVHHTVQAMRDRATQAQLRAESRRRTTAAQEERRRRVAELAADPIRAQYAPLVERGETWTDAHITYYENSALTATCIHLRPIEQAMRAAGIDVRLFKEEQVTAHCHIDLPRLRQTFPLSASIRYAEFFAGDPESHERPTAFLICDDHKSMIHTVHPDSPAPIFPAFFSASASVTPS